MTEQNWSLKLIENLGITILFFLALAISSKADSTITCGTPTLVLHTSLDGNGTERCSNNQSTCGSPGTDQSIASFDASNYQETSFATTTAENQIIEWVVNCTGVTGWKFNVTVPVDSACGACPASDACTQIFYLWNYSTSAFSQIQSNSGTAISLMSPLYLNTSEFVSGGIVRIKVRTTQEDLQEYEDALCWDPIQIFNKSLPTPSTCLRPGSGDWVIENSTNCTIDSSIFFAGNLNISNESNLLITSRGALTLEDGAIFLKSGSIIVNGRSGQTNNTFCQDSFETNASIESSCNGQGWFRGGIIQTNLTTIRAVNGTYSLNDSHSASGSPADSYFNFTMVNGSSETDNQLITFEGKVYSASNFYYGFGNSNVATNGYPLEGFCYEFLCDAGGSWLFYNGIGTSSLGVGGCVNKWWQIKFQVNLSNSNESYGDCSITINGTTTLHSDCKTSQAGVCNNVSSFFVYHASTATTLLDDILIYRGNESIIASQPGGQIIFENTRFLPNNTFCQDSFESDASIESGCNGNGWFRGGIILLNLSDANPPNGSYFLNDTHSAAGAPADSYFNFTAANGSIETDNQLITFNGKVFGQGNFYYGFGNTGVATNGYPLEGFCYEFLCDVDTNFYFYDGASTIALGVTGCANNWWQIWFQVNLSNSTADTGDCSITINGTSSLHKDCKTSQTGLCNNVTSWFAYHANTAITGFDDILIYRGNRTKTGG